MRQPTGVIAGLAVAISVWACLPFSTSYIASPPIVGDYHAETGEPLGGVQLAISTVDGDSLCASPAIRTTTDSAGAFSLPATEGHRPVIVLAPIDVVYGYTFCARVTGTMRFAFEESSRVNESFSSRPVSLICIESPTPTKAPVECTKER